MTPDSHPQYAALLRAVIARPQDDLPRLVFADWLDERGEGERAEFIRVQCELANAPPLKCHGHAFCKTVNPDCWHCFKGPPLRRRERELLLANDAQWNDDWYSRLTNAPVFDRWTFARGFVEEVTCSWAAFQAVAAALTAATPLRKVTLTTWPTAVAPLLPVTHTGAWQALLEGMHPGIEFVLSRRNEDWHVAPEDREAHARDVNWLLPENLESLTAQARR